MDWLQNYNPLGNTLLSTLVAALPIVVLLTSIALVRMRIHRAALLGLLVALVVAVGVFKMPPLAATGTALYGAAYGLFPIGWIVLNLMFLYQLTVEKGLFTVLRCSLARVAPDPRIQVILIAFSLGAFFEGVAGFGTPVAITSAILIQFGFRPLAASGLSLIANTAPVAFGSLGTPIVALQAVTGLDLYDLSAMVGRQLPFFSLLIPFWVVMAMSGWRGLIGIWPVALVAGGSFALPQYLVSNFHGPWLVDIIAGLCSMGATLLLLRFWQPRELWPLPAEPNQPKTATPTQPVYTRAQIWQAWRPWVCLTLCIFLWGMPGTQRLLNRVASPTFAVPHVHKTIVRSPPVVPVPTSEHPTPPEEAVFKLFYLSATGTGILVAALLAGWSMGYSALELVRRYGRTIYSIRFSLITITAMLSLGYVTKYSGTDATLGLALAQTGSWYPFFGTLLGWLGVALTGSDTASNVLFGSLQTMTAEKTGISPTLMAAANSSGGVMGKMVDAQSIVVASTATGWYGHEGAILRFVFFHSLILAALVGILVTLQAYVAPFNQMVPQNLQPALAPGHTSPRIAP